MFQRFGQFRGETVEQLLSWATTILGNVFLMEMRHLYAAKRDVRRQEPLEAPGGRWMSWIPHAEEPVDRLARNGNGFLAEDPDGANSAGTEGCADSVVDR